MQACIEGLLIVGCLLCGAIMLGFLPRCAQCCKPTITPLEAIMSTNLTAAITHAGA